MNTINIGILAHVDAGKTSLTESLLHTTGAIQQRGKVDQGNTVTDSMALEQERGITIKAATVSTQWQGTKINLIDTPGHMDFIAEVERTFAVLDGAILLISANEGVQEQTRVIYKKLQEQHIPTLVFINKIDIPFVDVPAVLMEIKQLLKKDCFPLDQAQLTSEQQDFLLNHSEDLEERFLASEDLELADYERELMQQINAGDILAYYSGSAMQDIGITALLTGIVTYFEPRPQREQATGYVYKIDHDQFGKKKIYLRLFGQGLAYGETVTIQRTQQKIKLKNMSHFCHGQEVSTKTVATNDIFVLRNMPYLKIGDLIGEPLTELQSKTTILPRITTSVAATKKAERGALLDALTILTVEDPTLQYQINPTTQDIIVKLYGEVQKEVLATYLVERFQLDVLFGATQLILKERLTQPTAVRVYMTEAPNPYWATIGLRCEPLPPGTGNEFISEVSPGFLTKSFQHGVWEGMKRALAVGLYGWELIDTRIVLEFAEFASPVSTPADFRQLAPYVLWLALEKVGTEIHEPYVAFELSLPQALTSRVLAELQKINVSINNIVVSETEQTLIGQMSEQKAKDFHPTLTRITNGKGLLLTQHIGYEKISHQEEHDLVIDATDQLRVLFKKKFSG